MFESSDTITILIAIIGVGGVLAGMAWRMAARLDRRIDEERRAADADRRAFQTAMDAARLAADAERQAFQSAAAEERRAFQRAMDDFRAEMQRLAERQSRVEGRFDAAE